MLLQLHPSVTATDTEDAVLVSLFLTVRDSPVLTPVRVMVLWKAASFEWDPNQTFLGWWMKVPYLREVAQMCIFSPSTWKGASKTLGSAQESSRQKRCYSPFSLSSQKSSFALFIKSSEQLHWCRWQVLLEGLLATKLWPGDYCPNSNTTGDREKVRLRSNCKMLCSRQGCSMLHRYLLPLL